MYIDCGPQTKALHDSLTSDIAYDEGNFNFNDSNNNCLKFKFVVVGPRIPGRQPEEIRNIIISKIN